MRGDLIEQLARLMESLPPNPVAPENRRYAQLLPTQQIPPGIMYRMPPNPEVTGDTRPRIMMNVHDVKNLRALFRAPWLGLDVDQEIADMAEQLFAQQEAREGAR